MPIFKPGWMLCIGLITQSVLAAPSTDLPPAPTPLVKENISPVPAIKTVDIPPTTFTQSEQASALNLGVLESIQSETVLYEAQLARVKALSELQKNGYDRSLAQPFNPAPPAQDNSKTEVKGSNQTSTPPQVVEIAGSGKGYSALLSLSNGNQVTVQTGNRIPGTDFVVKKISLDEVVVSSPDQPLVSLSFAG